MMITKEDVKRKTEERFWSKINFLEDGCWEWLAALDKDGYGRYHVKTGKKFKSTITTRFAYRNLVCDFDPKLQVLHKCDNPKCVNPNHLFLGTQKQNIRDMMNKNRKSSRVGSLNTASKLTEEKVKLIKLRIQEGESTGSIGKAFGVCGSLISMINTGKRWSHINV